MSVSTERVRARIVTSHRIPAYGGFQIPEETLRAFAAGMVPGPVVWNFNHDIARPLRVILLEAGTERLDDGHLAVWGEYEVPAEGWAEHQAELKSANAPGGMSVTIMGTIDDGSQANDAGWITVAADAHHFAEGEILAARDAVQSLDRNAGAAYLFQFAFEPPPTVTFEFIQAVASGVGLNIVASAVYDACKKLLVRRRGQRTPINIHFTESRRGTRKFSIKIEARTPEEIRATLESLPAVVEAASSDAYVGIDGGALAPLDPQGGSDRVTTTTDSVAGPSELP